MRKTLAHYYAEDMYEHDRARASAQVVVPMVTALVHPTKVIDIGCGRGAWLRAFKDNGAGQIVGLDGDYIDLSTLLIPSDCFRPTNLAGAFETPAGSFDLAVCLEVAEHLPARQARHLVARLAAAAPVVLFSAAPPGQGGGGHVNCQPLSYWRALFEERGMKMLDPLRPRTRDDAEVAWWYRQNMVMFATPEAIAANPALAACGEVPKGRECEWVYMHVADARALPANVARNLIARVWRRAKKALRRGR
jgi:SAM-dependent methyltransferase